MCVNTEFDEMKMNKTISERIVLNLVVYYESIKRELKTKLIHECRCDERLKTKVEESTRLACTVLHDKTN